MEGSGFSVPERAAREVKIVRTLRVQLLSNGGVYVEYYISILSSFGVLLPPRLLICLEVRSAIRPPATPL